MIYLDKILTSNQLKILWGSDGNTFQKRLSYNLKKGNLLPIRKGIYVVGQNGKSLSDAELLSIANKIYSPSYISFETVLQDEGVIFQYDSSIKLASRYKKSLILGSIGLKCDFFKMPEELLVETLGIENRNGYTIATKERAFCDILFRSPNFYFDNLSGLDRDLIWRISEIFKKYKKSFDKKVLLYKSQICEFNSTRQ